jgi:hypothetical protein
MHQLSSHSNARLGVARTPWLQVEPAWEAVLSKRTMHPANVLRIGGIVFESCRGLKASFCFEDTLRRRLWTLASANEAMRSLIGLVLGQVVPAALLAGQTACAELNPLASFRGARPARTTRPRARRSRAA